MKPQQQSEAHLHALDYWQTIRNRYGVILLSFFLVFMTAAVVTVIMPKKYMGKVLMEIERVSATTGDFVDPLALGKGQASPTFLPTEFKIITSKKNLYSVIEQLGLVKRWNMSSLDEAYYKLEDMIDADEERGTDLIRISVYSTDRKEAPELANAVAKAYVDRRNDTEAERTEKAFETLEASKKKQEDKVDASRDAMHAIIQKYQIIDVNPSYLRGVDPNSGSGNIVLQVKSAQAQKESEIADFKSRLNIVKGKTGEELISAASSMGIVDPKNSVYLQYLNDKTSLQSMMDEGRGPRHPDILAMKSKLNGQQEVLEQMVASLRQSLEDNLKSAEMMLENIKKQAETKTSESIDERAKYAEYQKAKDDYSLQMELYQKMIEGQEKARLIISMPKMPATIHEEATEPQTYAKPNAILQLSLGAVLGLILGLGFAFFLEYLDTSVKTLDDVERYLGVPVLAVIPKDVGILHKQSGISPDAEAYRILRTNIEFNRKSADANSITVVSGGAGEGKSTTLVNLAYICAQGGYNTLMIDADLRRPKLHTFFDINNSVGLTNYLTTDLQLEDVILQTPIDNLYFMPSGILPADAAGILNSRRMSELIADVKNRFDLVLIDSPPILGVSDASVLASEVDLTMIVIQHRKLPRSMLMRVKQAIENVGGNLLGVVLNNVDVRSDSQYQYYTSYYTYYSPTNSEPKAKTRPAKSESTSKPSKPAKASKSVAAADDDQY